MIFHKRSYLSKYEISLLVQGRKDELGPIRWPGKNKVARKPAYFLSAYKRSLYPTVAAFKNSIMAILGKFDCFKITRNIHFTKIEQNYIIKTYFSLWYFYGDSLFYIHLHLFLYTERFTYKSSFWKKYLY